MAPGKRKSAAELLKGLEAGRKLTAAEALRELGVKFDDSKHGKVAIRLSARALRNR